MSSTFHVGIIMDGNGRWAERRGQPRTAGHRAGVRAVRRIVESAPTFGVRTLTVYAFSADNWRRPELEVRALLRLLRAYLISETDRLIENGVRIQFVGRRDRLSAALVDAMQAAEISTRECNRLTLRIALDYSSREALVGAAQRMAATGKFDRQSMAEALGAEDIDLVIRTAGEQRLSDFFLWECAYAEFVFTDRLWPDFNAEDLQAAIDVYSRRTRKFGGLPAMAS